ncbi:MAG: DUF2889 domain-containing protein [Bacillota bacterium]
MVMKFIHHSHWNTSVQIVDKDSLLGRTVFLSGKMECSAGLLVNIKTFRIEKARWEIYNGPDGPLSADINTLAGVEAYMGSGKELRAAVLNNWGEKAYSMVSETVRGIIQSETYLFKERGYKNAKSYDEYWNRMYLNSCRYYSNLDRVTTSWQKHISGQKRFKNLYNKFKAVSVQESKEVYSVNASLSDSFHEVGLNLTLDKKIGTVSTINCLLMRCPDPVCAEAGSYAHNLLGQQLTSMSKKELAESLAGPRGCVHIIDLIHDVSTVLGQL